MITRALDTLFARAARPIVLALGGLALAAAPAAAQVETFDPDDAYAASQASGAIDADLVQPQPGAATSTSAPVAIPAIPPVGPNASTNAAPTVAPPLGEGSDYDSDYNADSEPDNPEAFDDEFAIYSEDGETAGAIDPATGEQVAAAGSQSQTYGEDDLIGAAEGVFGKGAEGLARMIEDLLRKQGEPNGYIVGREAGGAFIIGARYGSGTLFHKVEGEQKVYWTGPSIGLDAGANAANTFVLVYNLFDSEDLFERYPAGEGQAYLIGGLHASYMRRGDVVLIPIRMGAGVRLGINAGYMKFSKKQRWLPF